MSKYCECGACKALYNYDWKGDEWEDDLDDYYFSGMTANRPKRERIKRVRDVRGVRTKHTTKLIRNIVGTIFVMGSILFIIWLPQALWSTITTIGQ